MAGTPLSGEAVPDDGRLPASVDAAARPLSVYVHVPFCASRCGYCDFNTYTAAELGPGVDRASYADDAITEVRQARRVLAAAGLDPATPVSTVFVGGGTPTLLQARDLARILAAVRDEFGLADGAEVTTEANPDSVDAASLAALRSAGFTRVSFGMQSASPGVLAVLERTHTPGRAALAVAEARAAGFEHVNVDLIYATPGETDAQWRDSLAAAVATGADHVSAYSLIVEDGTRLAARVRRGELPAVDDDVAASRYEIADEVLSTAGMQWYEVSNWARPGAECRHNLAYWRGHHWWGVGPGAHSHVDGVRWWNVRHPARYAERVRDQRSPAEARERLDASERQVEDVMLRLRLREGLPLSALPDLAGARASGEVAVLLAQGLLDPAEADRGVLVLTPAGRLVADAVVRRLLD